jgi:hypothetical protein
MPKIVATPIVKPLKAPWAAIASIGLSIWSQSLQIGKKGEREREREIGCYICGYCILSLCSCHYTRHNSALYTIHIPQLISTLYPLNIHFIPTFYYIATIYPLYIHNIPVIWLTKLGVWVDWSRLSPTIRQPHRVTQHSFYLKKHKWHVWYMNNVQLASTHMMVWNTVKAVRNTIYTKTLKTYAYRTGASSPKANLGSEIRSQL